MNRKIPFFLSLILFLIGFIPVVYADTVPHNLLDIPQGVSDTLGIGIFAAGLLVSVILLMIVALPALILTIKARGGQGMIFVMIAGLSVLGFCVAVTWFPVWFFAIIVLLIGVMYGKKLVDAF